MDFIAEIIMEVIMGLFVELPMESEHVKTWVKTVIFLIVCGLLDGFTGLLFYQVCFVEFNLFSVIVVGAVLLFLLGLTFFGAITGHKRDWKQE